MTARTSADRKPLATIARTTAARVTVLAFLVAASAVAFNATRSAFAQEHGGAPSPEEIKQKVIEIEKLMKQAEVSLARSTDERAAREATDRIEKLLDEKSQAQTGKSAEQLRRDAAGGSTEAAETLRKLMEQSRTEAGAASEAARKLLDEKVREATGKSAEELRKLAEGGSKEAQEQLQKLTESAASESGSAAEGVRKILEQVGESGKGASQGIEWILTKAVSKGGTRSEGDPSSEKPHGDNKDEKDKPQPQKPDKPKDPKDPSQQDKKPPGDEPPPPGGKEKPRTPEFDVWFAELPPQVRKAYETQDWDSIPPRWRELLRSWTKKMADDLEKERR